MLLLIDSGSQHTPAISLTHSQQDTPSAVTPSTLLRSSEQPAAGPSTLPTNALASTLEDGGDRIEDYDIPLGDSIDWAEVDREVDDFLNETDDDDIEDYEGQSEGSAHSSARLVPIAFYHSAHNSHITVVRYRGETVGGNDDGVGARLRMRVRDRLKCLL